jgi:hypothetical protein
MILLDLNQVMISNLMMQIGNNQNNEIEEDLVRHMVLNSLRLYKGKFGEQYGDLVICCDDKNYWRKQMFPYYKAHRKNNREKSPLDWNKIFTVLNTIRDELKEHFPWRVLQIETAEADDIIGTLCHRFGKILKADDVEPILILSGDKDFGQLQKYANVEQFSPITKKWIRINNPEAFLREHIMKGDRGDGIPNFLSGDNCIVAGQRQKPLMSKKLDTWISLNPVDFCNEFMLRNYKRNEALVNLDMIPQEIQTQINKQYDEYQIPERKGMLNYFIKKRLKNLMEHVGEF